MVTLAERLDQAARRLATVSDTPRLDAEYLLAHALGLTRSRLLAQLHASVETDAFEPLVRRRLLSEPIPYILGEWEFYSLPLRVRPPVLVPRPETEVLVEAVLARAAPAALRVLELGTGTGCIALALARNAPAVSLVATDIDVQALALASENLQRHGLEGRVRLRQGDLFHALEPGDSPFDIVCSNPPYVAEDEWGALSAAIRLYESRAALLAGPDGLELIRRIVAEARGHLTAGGLLALEIGESQGPAVRALLETHGYSGVRIQPDLAGRARVALARA